jgi:ELWxxDGT repeat protein
MPFRSLQLFLPAIRAAVMVFSTSILSGAPLPEPVRVEVFPSGIFGTAGSEPRELQAAGGRFYFTARTGTHGRELWTSDGTAVGTVMAKDIWPGSEGRVEELTTAGGTAYFTAEDGKNGVQLWKSDGTTEGTVMVRENTGRTDIDGAGNLAVLGGSIIFRSWDAIWKTDGTSEGTVKLQDLSATWDDLAGKNAATAGNTVFLVDREDHRGSSLWKTDGTSGGTLRIKDFTSDAFYGPPRQMTPAGDRLFFTLARSNEVEELWQSDGTSEGTVKLKDFSPSTTGIPQELVAWGDAIFFATVEEAGTLVLWRADGETGTVSSVGSWTPGTNARISMIRAGEDCIYFGFAGGPSGFELWKSDGTSAGTIRVAVLPEMDADQLSAVVWAGDLYFSILVYPGIDDPGAFSLWRSDGTEAGTTRTRDFPAGYSWFAGDLMPFGSFLYFPADSEGEGEELWRTDGTSEGTGLFKDLSGISTTPPYHLVEAGGMIYFSVNKGESDEVWKTDGTAQGTVLVKSIELTESWSPALSELVVAGNDVYFTSSEAPFWSGEKFTGCKLWRISAPSGEAVLVKSFPKEAGFLGGLTAINGMLYLTGFPEPDSGLPYYWKTDGTQAGTVSAHGDYPDLHGYPRPEAVAGGISYFSVGRSVWKSDGTQAGTVPVKNLGDDAEHGLGRFTAVGDTVFFFTYSGPSGHLLWKTDGTTEGTIRITTGFPSWEAPGKPVATTDAIYFNAGSRNGLRLWMCRADADIAIPVDAAGGVPPSIMGSRPLMGDGSRLYFAAMTSYTESELWITDGSPSGTRRIKNISPSISGSLFQPPFATYHGEFFFAARTPETGLEIWRTDGTEEGTRILKDVVPGTGDSQFPSPYPLQVFGRKLFFTAMTEEVGPCLHVYDNSTMDPPDIADTKLRPPGLYSAGLNGVIFPKGSATRAWLEYGPTTAFGKSVPLPLQPSNSTIPLDFTARLPDLAPGTTYHYRILAENAGGTRVTATGVFTTAAITGPFGMEAPPSHITRTPDRPAELRFEVIARQTCELQRSTDLNEWLPLATLTADAAGIIVFADGDSPPGTAFYRLAVPPPAAGP